jgi:hypothetical protein
MVESSLYTEVVEAFILKQAHGGFFFRLGRARFRTGSSQDEGTLMMPDAFPRGSYNLEKKGVLVRLRGGQRIQGLIHIPEGLSLLHFLGSKKFFLNLTSVRLLDDSEALDEFEHLSLRISNIVWIVPNEGTLHVSGSGVPTGSSRSVELHLVDGIKLAVDLSIADEQRMSDYLDANWAFLPLWSATVPSTSEVIERLAVNHEAILAIREMPGP